MFWGRLACPVGGCHGQRRGDQVMCGRCWRRVPTALRREIWRLYDDPDKRGSVSHHEAIGKAIAIAAEGIAT